MRRFSLIREDEMTESSDGSKSMVRRYIAHLETNYNAELQIVYAQPFLAMWQPHPERPELRVANRRIKQHKHSLIFYIDVTYSNKTPPQSPLEEPAKIRWETTSTTVPITHDPNTRRPFRTTAGTLIEGITENVGLWQASVVKEVSGVPAWVERYGEGCINSDFIRIDGKPCAPKTLKWVSGSLGEYKETNGTRHRPLSMKFLYKPQTWTRSFLNRDTVEVVIRTRENDQGVEEAYLTTEPIIGENGQPITKPAWLDEYGRRPRVDSNGRLVSLVQELAAFNQGRPITTTVKHPLDPSDLRKVTGDTLLLLPFNRLPIS